MARMGNVSSCLKLLCVLLLRVIIAASRALAAVNVVLIFAVGIRHVVNFHQKKRRVFVKPVVRTPKHVDHITGDRIPKSFVFSRGKLPGPLRQLQMDLRKLMLPYTALKLKEKKRNNLRDFLNVAGPMGVTNFLILSKTDTASYLRVARTPQGPTLTFKIEEYALAADIAQSQLRPRCPQDLFKNPPLVITTS